MNEVLEQKMTLRVCQLEHVQLEESSEGKQAAIQSISFIYI